MRNSCGSTPRAAATTKGVAHDHNESQNNQPDNDNSEPTELDEDEIDVRLRLKIETRGLLLSSQVPHVASNRLLHEQLRETALNEP
jgi:hypothetical protein